MLMTLILIFLFINKRWTISAFSFSIAINNADLWEKINKFYYIFIFLISFKYFFEM